MSPHRSVKLFATRPWSSFVLAALMICLGVVFVSGWIQPSPNRRYFPGHEWFMASISWGLAVFFAHCARVGLRNQAQERKE